MIGSKTHRTNNSAMEEIITHADPVPYLILMRIRLYARRRVAWLRKLWAEEGEGGGQIAVTHAEIDTVLFDRDAPASEMEWYSTNEGIKALNQELETLEKKIDDDDSSCFASLRMTFGLSKEETDILQLCLALRLDPSLGRVYAYLHDHTGRAYASEELALRLFCYGHSSIWRKDSPLSRWEIIHEKEGSAGEPSMLKCDTFILQWLLGQDVMDAVLTPLAHFHHARPPLQSWPLDSTIEKINRLLKGGTTKVRLVISGTGGSGRKTMAALICNGFNMRLLVIDTDQADQFPEIYLHAQRKAILDHCGIAWTGAKAIEQLWPTEIPGFPLQIVICEHGQKPKPVNYFTDVMLEMPEPGISEQADLIRDKITISNTWDPIKLNSLFARHRLNIGDIVSMKERDVQSIEESLQVIRENSRHKLGTLAQLLECPFQWDDMVLTDFLRDTLEDFIFEARERKQFWEQERVRKMFPLGRGLIGLFSGPAGTGKTMAAQVIAARLGLDLFRIDLSSVVSKYVGETSQNLERILSRAEHMDIVLFFDEADALFGKRTEVRDAHDRFANTDTNYLLQAIENYGGIAILATNRKENIDTAFIRRLRYVLEFPRPDAGQREKLWVKILQKLLPVDNKFSLNGQLALLSTHVEMTGAQIKFAVLSAAFAARRDQKDLGMKHLLRGIERELIKEGRSLSKQELEKLMINEG